MFQFAMVLFDLQNYFNSSDAINFSLPEKVTLKFSLKVTIKVMLVAKRSKVEKEVKILNDFD